MLLYLLSVSSASSTTFLVVQAGQKPKSPPWATWSWHYQI